MTCCFPRRESHHYCRLPNVFHTLIRAADGCPEPSEYRKNMDVRTEALLRGQCADLCQTIYELRQNRPLLKQRKE